MLHVCKCPPASLSGIREPGLGGGFTETLRSFGGIVTDAYVSRRPWRGVLRSQLKIQLEGGIRGDGDAG